MLGVRALFVEKQQRDVLNGKFRALRHAARKLDHVLFPSLQLFPATRRVPEPSGIRCRFHVQERLNRLGKLFAILASTLARCAFDFEEAVHVGLFYHASTVAYSVHIGKYQQLVKDVIKLRNICAQIAGRI